MGRVWGVYGKYTVGWSPGSREVIGDQLSCLLTDRAEDELYWNAMCKHRECKHTFVSGKVILPRMCDYFDKHPASRQIV